MFEIRQAKYSDFEAIKKIFETSFDEEYRRRGLDIVQRITRWQQIYPIVKVLSTFNNPYQHLFNVHVYDEDGEIAGMVQTTSRSKDQTRWHIENIAVLPNHRGKGIAKKLLSYIFENYSEKGVNRFTLEVDVESLNVVKLYEKVGFRKYTTVNYYKLSKKKAKKILTENKNIKEPEGFQEFSKKDAESCLDLYTSCTPSSIRIVDQKSITDFYETPFEQATLFLKEQLKKSLAKTFVVKNDKGVIASLEIVAQYRELPHVIRLLVHNGYPELNEQLLLYSLNFLKDFPDTPILIAASAHQKAKIELLKNFKVKCITSDHLMVKDNLQLVQLPERNGKEKMSLDNNGGFKPIFTKKEN